MKLNNKKGISLIVLVITIIVMIILAAAIILSLQSSGIIGKANEAKAKSDEKNMLQAANVAYSEYVLENSLEEVSSKSAEEYVKEKLNDKFSQEDVERLSILSDGTIQILPVIPKEFVISQIESEKKISEGLVIYEIPEDKRSSIDWNSKANGNIEYLDVQEEYNQYVWVPVEDINEFIRKDGYTNQKLQDYVLYEDTTEPFSDGELSEQNDLTGEYAEYKAMKASVEKYGGFYIGRYEAGKNENELVIQRGEEAWGQVPWGESMSSVGNEGAVYLSRSLYPKDSESKSVTTLCYGVQWDAIINFMKDVPNPNVPGKNYIEDSTGMGYYGYDKDFKPINTSEVQLTGSSDMYKVKNIYDLAGNVAELTMEGHYRGMRIFRGGSCAASGYDSPSSYRHFINADYKGRSPGFRVALYLK